MRAWTALVFQVAPATLVAGLLSALGLALAANQPSQAFDLPLLLLAVALFLGLLVLWEVTPWNLALLGAFALVAGAVIGRWTDSGGGLWARAALVALGALTLGGAAGRRLAGVAARVGHRLWPLTWLYLVGWLLWAFWQPRPWLPALWGSLGLVLFVGLSAAWFATLETRLHSHPSTTLACELYLYALNLALAAEVLLARGL